MFITIGTAPKHPNYYTITKDHPVVQVAEKTVKDRDSNDAGESRPG